MGKNKTYKCNVMAQTAFTVYTVSHIFLESCTLKHGHMDGNVHMKIIYR